MSAVFGMDIHIHIVVLQQCTTFTHIQVLILKNVVCNNDTDYTFLDY